MSDPAEPLFVHHPGDAWDVERSLAVGDRLRLELVPAGGYQWSAVESSDPEIAAVVTTPTDGGAARADVAALAPGVVILRATTLHTGDRFGPPTRLWRMTLHIGT